MENYIHKTKGREGKENPSKVKQRKKSSVKGKGDMKDMK
jgi:hypothetical protein